MNAARRRLAVVGGGWAGLAAAVQGTLDGHAVTLFEMAPQLGGRARAVNHGDQALDNGQHILIGAYAETLRLMRAVGVDVDAALLRTPLQLCDPQGVGLQLPAGPAMPAFLRGVLARRGWPVLARLRLLVQAGGWWACGFRCSEALSVGQLAASLPEAVQRELIEPLCVAALNTPAGEASASVFLRVLRDALLTGPGSADLLLPRVTLSALWPEPAARWLAAHGAALRLGQRVGEVLPGSAGWRVDGMPFDAVVLATTATEAARLAEPLNPGWARQARSLRYEPIVTTYLHSEGTRLPRPMLTLRTDDAGRPDAWPAQFVFDHGALGGPPGRLALVASGAQAWVDAGLPAAGDAALSQARQQLGAHLKSPPLLLRTLMEKRATFRCTPGLTRPGATVAPGLQAAGDYVAGPYPATLEGAVRSGLAALRALP